ncbi:Winged helix-turn-helix transcription repressor DNA-binding protein [Cordyceps fumosorosea ARSEF 2679]|uniref:Methylated-DNA--protein-cysteine methyltransferase n=1 Tax=Cordyceps fumosorosea (strain ARSEF 2679) TaxID=1081104 RepID=A0A168ETA2_CORFA|nr:Winged helix-turn-helix transcription repressor DNA-binding protein [Cordyceps fumosorosea ARSEF 2679]OAA74191.1 Winged helix-turn-helix transcription repressor DNA-binding protein [Cordyceps fumosorosea ARSEF 2679]
MPTRITMYTPSNPHGTTTILTTTTTSSSSSSSSSSSPLGLTAAEAAQLTPFQARVFRLLAQVPAGRVTTYGALAAALRTSPRAVGNALRNNPFAPRVPCHRCVAATGYVNGYDGEVVQRASFRGEAGGAGVEGRASQSRAGRGKTATGGVKATPPSGMNVQKKLDLLRTEGVEFDDKGMLRNRYRVLFEGPWDIVSS